VQQRLQAVIDQLRQLGEQQLKLTKSSGVNEERIDQSAKTVGDLQMQIEAESRHRDLATSRDEQVREP
jgi:hypothetical protein